MGANVAMIYAGVRPARVRRLVNLEGFGLPRTDASQAPDRLGKWLDQLREAAEFGDYADAADLAARIAKRNPRLSPERAAFVAESGAVRVLAAVCACSPIPPHRMVKSYLYRREEMEPAGAASRLLSCS